MPGDGDTLALGDTDGLTLALGEADAEGLRLGLALADGDTEGEADAEGERLGEALADGESDGLADALGLRLGDADALGDSDADGTPPSNDRMSFRLIGPYLLTITNVSAALGASVNVSSPASVIRPLVVANAPIFFTCPASTPDVNRTSASFQ